MLHADSKCFQSVSFPIVFTSFLPLIQLLFLKDGLNMVKRVGKADKGKATGLLYCQSIPNPYEMQMIAHL
jgi:hypothetical protein